MKKTISLLSMALCICVSLTVSGQDIIYTKDGNSIQTKILEISDGKISYKLFDYQDGATIILDIAKIDSIIYQNGYVDKLNIHRVENSLPQLDEMDSDRKSVV